MSDWIEHDGKKYFEESYLEQANEAARRVRDEVRARAAHELRELADSSCHTIELYASNGLPYLEPTVLCRRLRQRADEIEAGL